MLCERLRTAVSATPVSTEAGSLTVTVSIGAAVVPGPGSAVDAVLRTADERLYAAKGAGRDRCLVATKCGIILPGPGVRHRYDFSRDHIVRSCEGSLKRLGVDWRRAKTWITSPDPAYLRKKRRATG